MFDQFADAKETVRHEMKDPDSTQFRDLKFCEDYKSVFGQVNSKNSFGAYTGFKDFVVIDGRSEIEDKDNYSAYHEFHRLCLPSMKLQPYSEIIPDNFETMAGNTSLASPASNSPIAPVDEMVPEHDVQPVEIPVCDREDSPEKFALMNEIGVKCELH
ncbi:hypothetical protein [Sphingobium sp.]|uniref:hypothetical protein n=1 Tax=Sphingobium sp. TaxID=1912891 RepID=UPI003BB63482